MEPETPMTIKEKRCISGQHIRRDGKPPKCNCEKTMNKTNKNYIDKVLEEFDERFVQNLGDKVEPVFIDPIGIVGPARLFLKQKLQEVEQKERERLLNQPANQHDQEVIKQERERIIEIIKAEQIWGVKKTERETETKRLTNKIINKIKELK